MPDPTPDVAAIARGLTKAQRTMLFPLRSGASFSATLVGNDLTTEDLADLRRYLDIWLSLAERRVAAYLAEGEAR